MNELPPKSTGLRKQLKRFDCGCEWEVALNDDGDIVGINYEPELANIYCKKVWELLASGLTKGVFQLETPLGQSTTKACKPYGVEELSDVNAILRPGCISGDTQILLRVQNISETSKRSGKYIYTRQSLQEIFYNKERYKNICSYDIENGILINNYPEDIIYSGKKEVYQVIFSKGIQARYKSNMDYVNSHLMNLECTSDHKLLTPYGWKELKDFKAGDRFAYIKVHKNKNKKIKNVDGHRTFQKVCWDHYEYKCLFCDWDEGALDTNHIDENRLVNNHPSNLCFLCPNHHRMYSEKKISKEEVLLAREIYQLPQKEDIIWVCFLEAKLLGVKDTYDIQMKGPHHNFIAGNVVVHNCGDAELDGKTLKQRYIDRKNGLENPDPLHPKLGDMLMSTQNIGVYQESYLTISKELAGFTAEESVAFLKSVAKKDTAKMAQFKDKFITGCVTSGLSEEDANDVFDIMEAGQRYAFNKCLDPLVKVKTPQGDQTLQDIKVGDLVLDHKGRYVKVLNKYYNGKKQTYLYTFKSGKTLRCTPDHRILVDSQLLRIQDVFNSGQLIGSDFIVSANTEKYIDTIDIEVCNEEHIFMANGVAVSNSHSVSYAYDALYFSAYAKSHFPKAFFLAELVAAKNTEEIGEVIDDSLNFKVDICKPDLRLLNDEFILSNRCIQYGLGRIKGVGGSKLAKLKDAIGNIDVAKMSWIDLLYCLGKTSSDAALALIYSGALDFTLLTRSRMMFELSIYNRLTEKQQEYIKDSSSLLSGLTSIVDMGSGKNTLCYNSASLNKAKTILNELNNPPFSLKDSRDQIFNWEIQHLGYAFTTSEIDESLSNCTCQDFNDGKYLKEYIIAGTVVRIKTIETKGKQPGQEMAFVEFKDSTNKVSGVAFPQTWIENSMKIYEGNKLMFFGTLGKKNSFVINRVMQL